MSSRISHFQKWMLVVDYSSQILLSTCTLHRMIPAYFVKEHVALNLRDNRCDVYRLSESSPITPFDDFKLSRIFQHSWLALYLRRQPTILTDFITGEILQDHPHNRNVLSYRTSRPVCKPWTPSIESRNATAGTATMRWIHSERLPDKESFESCSYHVLSQLPWFESCSRNFNKEIMIRLQTLNCVKIFDLAT